MAPKKTRINKNEWPSFIRDFNRQNQFRLATMSLGDKMMIGEPGAVLIGIAYEPKANKIEVYFGGHDKENPSRLAHTINGPRAIYLVRDYEASASNPVAGINIQGAPGSQTAYIAFLEISPEEAKQRWTSSLAYNIYEGRGMACGFDQEDWYEAELIIDKVSRPFLKE
jgi:hypothetical protein